MKLTEKNVESQLGKTIPEAVALGRPYPGILVAYSIQERGKKILHSVNEPIFGATLGVLDSVCDGKEYRYAVLRCLFPLKFPEGVRITSKRLSYGEKQAIMDWVKVGKNEETGKWVGDPALRQEINDIFTVFGVRTTNIPGAVTAEELTYIKTQKAWLKDIDGSLDKPEIEKVYAREMGIGTYKMTCGCQNSWYNVVGRPTCENHGLRGGHVGEWTHKLTYKNNVYVWQEAGEVVGDNALLA